jgi:hypothetical protein
MRELVLIFILGFVIGLLKERWGYFKKTGEHLQDIKKR